MKKLFTLVALAVMMFSCTKNDEATQNAEKFPINISVGQQTRANDSTFDNGDKVGIYVVNYDGSTAGTLAASGNQVDNAQFVYDGSKWTPEESIFWKDKNTAADFYAYYPYSASADIAAHPFSVQTDQSTENAFWASDFLWGKATKVSPTPNAVAIQTNHSLSRILVDIKPGNGFTAESWAAATKSVKICDVKTSATIDLSTGIATATGNNSEIIPLAAAETGTTLSYKAMMIPQLVADNSKLVVVTVDGVDYVYRKGFTFKANTQHKFTITVNKSGSSVDVTIGEWEIDETINEGVAEIEGESSSSIPNNQIWYTATAKVEPNTSADFGDVDIESNVWDSTTGEGVITFNGNITSIGDDAFIYCYNLTSITIPDSVTSIGDSTFGFCENLTSITIPNSVTSIGDWTFGCCHSLTNVTIPNSVISIGNEAFRSCSSLTSITIPNSVTSIGVWAFYGCNLTSVTIPDSITSIGKNVFILCDSLTSFYGKFASADNRCLIIDGVLNSFAPAGLTTYTIPDSVTSIGDDAFIYCYNLTSITIPNSVTSIGNSAFELCDSLASVYCKATTPPTLGEYNDVFEANASDRKIYVPAASVDAYKAADGWKDYADSIFADPNEN